MKVPISWLREYVDAPTSPQELARLLVMAGVGVESIESDVLDLEITANRADLLSMLGVARETRGNPRKPAEVPAVKFIDGRDDVPKACAVEVSANDLCPRWTARAVLRATVGRSPA